MVTTKGFLSGRQFVVAGPVMVAVKGGAHYSGRLLGKGAELGMCFDPVRIERYFQNDDVRTAGFGQSVPADVRHQLAYAKLRLTLSHHDPDLLEAVFQESMCAAPLPDTFSPVKDFFGEQMGRAGACGIAGKLMGANRPMYQSGNRFVAVSLIPAGRATPTRADYPYRFRKCHLTEMPAIVSLGSEISIVNLTFRCLPEQPFTGSALEETVYQESWASGAVVWDNTPDYPVPGFGG